MEKIKIALNKFNNYFDILLPNEGCSIYKIIYKFYLLIDVFYSYFIYGSTPTDYFTYYFFQKKHNVKKEFVTFKKAQLIYEALNSLEESLIFSNKNLFNQRYNKYVKRSWIYCQKSNISQLQKFCENKKLFMIKPNDQSEGRGVRMYKLRENEELDCLFKYLYEKNLIAEELVEQDSRIGVFHSKSVNTIRVTTVLRNKTVSIISAVLRIGNNNEIVDNYAHNGIIAHIDINTGIVCSKGVDKFLKEYIIHPISGKPIVGFKIPFWNDILQLVNEIAMITPTVRYVGWDVALTKTGPLIIEGNDRGQLGVQQAASQIGLWSVYKKYISKSKKKNAKTD